MDAEVGKVKDRLCLSFTSNSDDSGNLRGDCRVATNEFSLNSISISN